MVDCPFAACFLDEDETDSSAFLLSLEVVLLELVCLLVVTCCFFCFSVEADFSALGLDCCCLDGVDLLLFEDELLPGDDLLGARFPPVDFFASPFSKNRYTNATNEPIAAVTANSPRGDLKRDVRISLKAGGDIA